jgi:hypothetical protein
MQTDGNFVIYAANRQPIWATNTNGKGSGPYKLELKPDGSLLVYGSNTQIWTSSRRSSLGPPFTLIMQDDGNLVVYDRNHKPLWASNTNR